MHKYVKCRNLCDFPIKLENATKSGFVAESVNES